jgi:hypothetical protein
MTNSENHEATPASPPSQSKKCMGHISRLPETLQQCIADQITAGRPHKEILNTLAEAGHPGITSQNITSWKKAGYKNLMEKRERQKLRDTERQEAIQLAEQENGGLHVALIYIGVKQLMRVLSRFDSEIFQAKLEIDPSIYIALLRNISWLSRAGQSWTKLNKAKNVHSPSSTKLGSLSDQERNCIDQAIELI